MDFKASETMKNALFYEKIGNGIVRCKLCPHYCIIHDGKRGTCNVRKNINGSLYSEIFEKVAALGFDPIEKKPLYHFYPGSKIISIGAIGCNLKCSFCQNYRISQITPEEFEDYTLYTVDEIIEKALSFPDNLGIAFTYNEPGTFYEYMVSIASKARMHQLKTVAVTNGYINRQPLEDLLPLIDAFNVDLKAFSEGFYHKITKSKLAPVKKTIQRIAQSDSHMEITNLVIPGLNDNSTEFEEMVRWIRNETGPQTPLHISRYFPNFQKQTDATPLNTLLDLYEIAAKYLKFVYLGNVTDDDHGRTICDQCGTVVITRQRGKINTDGLDQHGNCKNCTHHIIDYVLP